MQRLNLNRHLASYRENLSQFFILTRHFYNRLFQNDYIAYEEEMKAKTISLLVLSASFFGYISNKFLFAYSIGRNPSLMWVDRCYILSYYMVIIGLIAILEWDSIFLDLRDYSNLVSLPINIRIILAAKFTSLCLFVGIFAVGTNAISVFIFTWYTSISPATGFIYGIPTYSATGLIYQIRFFFVHLISFAAAAFFTFFALIVLIAIAKSILGNRLFNRVSAYIKTALLSGCVYLIILLFFKLEGVAYYFNLLHDVKRLSHPIAYVFPPLWFVGLFESLVGHSDPYFDAMALIAVLALVLGFFSASLALGINFKLHLSKTVESGTSRKSPRITRFFFSTFDSVVLRNPIQRAVFHFFRLTLKRSNLHRARLTTFVSISIGIVLILLVYQSNSIVDNLKDNKIHLLIPLILSFFLLIGIKAVSKIPVSLDANWIFRLTEANEKHHYLLGIRKGIFFLLLVPLHAILFVFYSLNWGVLESLYHCLFCLVISFILMEALFFKSRKIAFTCSYLPGQERLHIFWFVYSVGFLMYVYLISWIESKLLSRPYDFIMFYGVMLSVYLCMRAYQRFILNRDIKIKYEEEPLIVVQTLDL